MGRLIDADMLLTKARTFLEKAKTDAYYSGSREVKANWDDAMRLIKEMPTASRWIPCSELLPKYGKTVLITNDKGNVSYGRFRGVEFWKEDGDNYWTWKKNTIEHVLAWMPLPEPYKEE